MADLGAEVIKIELPGKGDSSRNAGQVAGHPSSFFETNNRGVKSLTLNLKTDGGQEILYKLVKEADIFGQNFRPGAAERNGFGYEDLKKTPAWCTFLSPHMGRVVPTPICREQICWASSRRNR